MTLPLHGVIKGVGTDSLIKGLHRVLWKNTMLDQLFTIEIPILFKDVKAPRYYKAPQKRSLSEYEAMQESGDLVVTSVLPHPIAGMTDEQIRQRYPKRNAPMSLKRPRTDCAVLQFRDERWEWVEPICNYIEENRADAFEANELGRLIRERAAEIGRKPVEIYDAVHRVLAHAAGRNSILPAYFRGGGKGKVKEPRQAARLGRPNSAYLRGEVPSPGIHLSEEDKRYLSFGHSKFIKQGLSVHKAYLMTMGTWWSTGSKIDDGFEVPILKPAHERPTLAQFRYWGPRDIEGKSAYALLLKEGDWDKKFRSMLGSSLDGLRGVGQMAVMDATGTHVTLVSMTSMLDALGPAHRIVVHEGLTEVITGFYVGLEAPSERTARLAVYNSAIDKVELFSRFGVQITSDQVPACFYRKFRVDNGEARNTGSIQTTNAAGSGIEFVQRGRAELKQQAESGHRVMHTLLEDRLDGATRGKSPERGEEHSAIPACWSWFAYMAEFLRAVVYFNCHADASKLMARHPFRTEMERDNVPPRRAAMYAWCLKNNRIGIPAHDAEIIRAKCLPSYKAIVKQSGIYLCRNDRGAKIELVVGPRYSGPRAMELHWHDGKRTDFAIDVLVDPDHPNRIWFADDLGIHPFDNLSSDETAKREATLHDYCAMQDGRRVKDTIAQTETDQAQFEFISHRESKNTSLRKEKQAEIRATGGKVSKTRLKKDIKENRAREASVIANAIDPITRTPKMSPSAPQTSPVVDHQPASSNGSTPHSQKKRTLDVDQAVTGETPSISEAGSNQATVVTSSNAAGNVITDALQKFRAMRNSK